jgi:hypothetical protein
VETTVDERGDGAWPAPKSERDLAFGPIGVITQDKGRSLAMCQAGEGVRHLIGLEIGRLGGYP